MCMRQNREPSFEGGDADIDDPICQMREPPGALGDIVRRMKRRVLERSRANHGATSLHVNIPISVNQGV